MTFYYIKFNILPLGVSIEYKKNNFMVSFNSNYDKILIKYDTAIVYLQFSMLLKITWQSLYITKSRSSICTIKICCKSCYSINRKGGILVYSPPSKLIRRTGRGKNRYIIPRWIIMNFLVSRGKIRKPTHAYSLKYLPLFRLPFL